MMEEKPTHQLKGPSETGRILMQWKATSNFLITASLLIEGANFQRTK